MKKINNIKISSIIFMSACLGSLSNSASAVDGQILITQARALAGNVTPGDTAGFPVTISRSGSYRLAGDIIVPSLGANGIEATADNVELDLNGFSIKGPNICDSNGNCDTGTGVGVIAGVIKNGTVEGMGSHGVKVLRADNIIVAHNGGTGALCTLCSQISAYQNGSDGINVGNILGTQTGGVLTNCWAEGNGANGITNGGSGVSISNCTATRNGRFGIEVGPGSTVSNSVANKNGVTQDAALSNFRGGIVLRGGEGMVSKCAANNNFGFGISVGDSRVIDSSANYNTQNGIGASGGIITGNIITNNQGKGLSLTNFVGYGNNQLFSNAGGNIVGGISIAPNICESALCPSP